MDSMEFHGFHGFHGIPWNPWNSMESMEFHGFHGIPGAAPGASVINIQYNIKSISIIKLHFSQPTHIFFSKDRSASQKLSF